MKGTIAEIKAWLKSQETISGAELEALLQDSRAGVRQLARSCIKEQERREKERARLDAMWKYERECRARGIKWIAGVDEAGRGPLAGPVVAAAVILPADFPVEGLNDSKQLTAKERNVLKQRIEQKAIAIGIGLVDVAYIDRHNILQATYEAMRTAIRQLEPVPEIILADAVTIPSISINQQRIVKGDALSHSIAAASVIAKTTRDEWMIEAARKYPEYGFDQNMGYGTPEHLEALRKWGPTPLHRRSFAPVREWFTENEMTLAMAGEER
ncbi:ribonuclease HII [Thermoactinomyces daqus]|uniref:Ribonuclease HII n=1 Tax=Thermoactinomyces daqus TaxID=1329516 RepID=A0A7W1XCA9_9BACL|nr:ribonuclease HII [Thermoactinomyces daqus]MBA4544015.1 ribonuclease HII [Thermoactinomyces daqus]